MTMVKKTVSLDPTVAQAAADLAEGNLSAFINDAIARHVRLVNLRRLALVDAAERGPITSDAIDATLASIDAAR